MMADEEMREEFSVYQYFADGGCERVAYFVAAEEAARVAKGLVTSVGGRLGTTRRVIITDGLDCLAWEWKHGAGVSQ